eukprot:122614_1
MKKKENEIATPVSLSSSKRRISLNNSNNSLNNSGGPATRLRSSFVGRSRKSSSSPQKHSLLNHPRRRPSLRKLGKKDKLSKRNRKPMHEFAQNILESPDHNRNNKVTIKSPFIDLSLNTPPDNINIIKNTNPSQPISPQTSQTTQTKQSNHNLGTIDQPTNLQSTLFVTSFDQPTQQMPSYFLSLYEKLTTIY